MRAYTGIYLSEVSDKQVWKAEADILSPSKATPRVLEITSTMVSSFKTPNSRVEGSPMPQRLMEVFHRFDASRESGTSSFYTGLFRLDPSMRKIPYASAALSSLVVGDVPSSAIALLGDLELRSEAAKVQASENLPGYGKISFLQEGGCKARVVCQPSFWMQVYFRPASDLLFEQIRWLEKGQSSSKGVSCVLDQNTGAYLLQTWMKEGKKVLSYDLSSATDRFPIAPQLAYLKSHGMEDWSRPYEEASSGGRYYCPQVKKLWSYSVGQPMGLCGSFPLFHLTHHALLGQLAVEVKAPDRSFAVLGDDVLICHKGLGKAYVDVMAKLGVEISQAKSLHGSVQSFAGFKGITRTRKGESDVTVFRPFKHGQDFALQGKEVNILNALGSEVRGWSNWWSKALDAFSPTVPLRAPDLSPLITEPSYGERYDVAGSRWFGSLRNRIMFQMDNETLHSCGERIAATWNRERDTLFSRQGPDELIAFDAEKYALAERQRKKGFNQACADALMGFRSGQRLAGFEHVKRPVLSSDRSRSVEIRGGR